MPSAASLAFAFGPMPLILRTASGQMRVSRSASVSKVSPSGLSSSEAIFDSSLFGVTPIEQVSPVRAHDAVADALRHGAHAAVRVVRDRLLRAGHVGQVDVDLVDAAVLDQRRDLGHRRLEEARVVAVASKSVGSSTASGASIAAFISPMPEYTPRARAA